jgi:hypothetical protein
MSRTRLRLALVLAMVCSLWGCASNTPATTGGVSHSSVVPSPEDTSPPSTSYAAAPGTEHAGDSLIPVSEVHQVCDAISRSGLSSSGNAWVYDPVDSGSGHLQNYESMRGALCSYTTPDKIENLAIWIFRDPYPTSTVKADINLGLTVWRRSRRWEPRLTQTRPRAVTRHPIYWAAMRTPGFTSLFGYKCPRQHIVSIFDYCKHCFKNTPSPVIRASAGRHPTATSCN